MADMGSATLLKRSTTSPRLFTRNLCRERGNGGEISMGDGGGAGELFIVGRAKGFSLPSLSLLSVSLLNRVQLPPCLTSQSST